jgi:hypothetical protein
MARRKRGFIEDDISDSGGSDDDEITDDDPYQRKKRRKTDDDDSEDEGFGGRPKPTQRHDWAKAPAFVSGKKVDQSEVMDIPDVETLTDSNSDSDGADGQEDVDVDDADDTDNDANDNDNDSEPSKAPSPRVRDERRRGRRAATAFRWTGPWRIQITPSHFILWLYKKRYRRLAPRRRLHPRNTLSCTLPITRPSSIRRPHRPR